MLEINTMINLRLGQLAISADRLLTSIVQYCSILNLKPDAITPHSRDRLRSNCTIHERAQTRNTHVRPAITYYLELTLLAVSINFLMPVANQTLTL